MYNLKSSTFQNININQYFIYGESNPQAYVKMNHYSVKNLSKYNAPIENWLEQQTIVYKVGNMVDGISPIHIFCKNLYNIFLKNPNIVIHLLRGCNISTFVHLATLLSRCKNVYEYIDCGPLPDGSFPQMNSVEYFDSLLDGRDSEYFNI